MSYRQKYDIAKYEAIHWVVKTTSHFSEWHFFLLIILLSVTNWLQIKERVRYYNWNLLYNEFINTTNVTMLHSINSRAWKLSNMLLERFFHLSSEKVKNRDLRHKIWYKYHCFLAENSSNFTKISTKHKLCHSVVTCTQ